MMNSKLFTPASIGPLTLRNRTIRSAVFESMCPGNAPPGIEGLSLLGGSRWSGNGLLLLMQLLHRAVFFRQAIMDAP